MSQETLDVEMTDVSVYRPYLENLLEFISRDEETLTKYLFRGWYLSLAIGEEQEQSNVCPTCFRPMKKNET